MKTLAFHLQKGGVGKTTLSVTVAAELVSMGYKVVLIDCDPQGNSSSWLLEGKGVEPDYQLSDVLTGKADINDAIIEVEDNLFCLPTFGATSDLRDYAKGGGAASEPYAIADLIEDLPFDYAILDMGPGLFALETAALLATDEVVLTMTPEYFSLDGLDTWATAVQKIEKAMRAKVHYSKVVINAMNRSIGQMREVHAEALKSAREVYTIPQDAVFRKAQSDHVPPQSFTRAPMKSETREEIRKLAEALKNGSRGE